MALTAAEAFSTRSAGIGVLSIAWLLKLLAWLCRGVRTERRFWFVIAGGEVRERERESEARETTDVGEREFFFFFNLINGSNITVEPYI
jgi:hypothetical protein